MKTFLLVLSRALLFVVIAAAVVLAQGAYFYEAPYQAPSFEKPELQDIGVTVPALTEFKESTEQRQGRLLVDLSSDNDFNLQEMSTLFVRAMSYGYTLSYLDNRADLEKELGVSTKEPEKEPVVPTKEPEKKPEKEPVVSTKEPEKKLEKEPEKKVEPANAFVVIAPRKKLSMENARAIKEFVKKGGKLLLIADPSRPNELSWLSSQFGLIFEKDYLYNMKENDGNFRNIFVSDFKDNEITKGLRKIAFYCAGSISPIDKGIVFTDQNTFSSLEITGDKFSPMALAEESKVLAIADITFLTQPLNAAFDNDHLIANIASWLTKKPSGGQ